MDIWVLKMEGCISRQKAARTVLRLFQKMTSFNGFKLILEVSQRSLDCRHRDDRMVVGG